jgi:hypothetical protein
MFARAGSVAVTIGLAAGLSVGEAAADDAASESDPANTLVVQDEQATADEMEEQAASSPQPIVASTSSDTLDALAQSQLETLPLPGGTFSVQSGANSAIAISTLNASIVNNPFRN